MSDVADSRPSELGRIEHNEDASAKRVVSYFQDNNGDWVQVGVPLVPGVDYNHLSASSTDTDEDTLTLKTGGSGGTTVQTVVINYPSGADKVSDSISTIDWS